MRCIWQMDGDKVKGFKCELSPVDMLVITSGLRYVIADPVRDSKDRKRAQYIYDKIMLDKYENELQMDGLSDEYTIQGTGDCDHCSRLFVDCGGR